MHLSLIISELLVRYADSLVTMWYFHVDEPPNDQLQRSLQTRRDKCACMDSCSSRPTDFKKDESQIQSFTVDIHL